MSYLEELQREHRARKRRLFMRAQTTAPKRTRVFPLSTAGTATGRMFIGLDPEIDQRRSAVQIIESVLKVAGLGRRDFMSGYRARHLVTARHIAAYLMHRCTRLSYPQIAQRIGWRHHTTAIHGVRRATKDLRDDPLMKAVVMDLGLRLTRVLDLRAA